MDEKLSSTAVIRINHGAQDKAQYDLPQSYGATESYLLPKDPNWMFLFWDIVKETYEYIKDTYGQDIFERAKSIIRVYDITDKENFDGSNANSFFDIDVVLDARSWYINAASAKRYICDVGLITPDGTFILLTRSNATTLPPGRVSNVIDEKWMMVEGDYQKLLKMSGQEMFGANGGASEKLQHFFTHKWKMFEFDSNALPSSHVSSWSSAALARPQAKEETDEDIWLKADCELIVYGQASKNAKVMLGTVPLKLNEDGTFSLRYSLQEGQVVIPIRAEHKTKAEKKRAITIKAQRQKEA